MVGKGALVGKGGSSGKGRRKARGSLRRGDRGGLEPAAGAAGGGGVTLSVRPRRGGAEMGADPHALSMWDGTWPN